MLPAEKIGPFHIVHQQTAAGFLWPLFNKGAKKQGTFKITAYDVGEFKLDWQLIEVARAPSGEGNLFGGWKSAQMTNNAYTTNLVSGIPKNCRSGSLFDLNPGQDHQLPFW